MELISTKRTYYNILKYLSIYEIVTPLSDEEIQQQMQIKECITISVFDKEANKRIIACISKHSSQTTRENKLIKTLYSKMDFIPIKNDTDIMFIIYDTDADTKIEKHKKKIKDYEGKCQEQYKQFHISMKFYSYNRFRFTLEELERDGIIKYTVVKDEIEVMSRIGMKKGNLPTIFLNDDPALILMHAKVGQIVQERLFNKSCGVQVTYKRII